MLILEELVAVIQRGEERVDGEVTIGRRRYLARLNCDKSTIRIVLLPIYPTQTVEKGVASAKRSLQPSYT